MDDPLNNKSYIIKANLAEFEAVKREIQARSDRQTTVVTACITVIGAIASLYFSVTAEARIFFVIPLFCFILGMNWIDHAASIHEMGFFNAYEP
jgi:hypothetical protein